MSDNGEAAIARERTALEAEEEAKADERFRAKLAYWRANGAPAYHGPRAVERGSTTTDFLIALLLLAYIGFVGYWIVKNIYWAITL